MKCEMNINAQNGQYSQQLDDHLFIADSNPNPSKYLNEKGSLGYSSFT